MNLKKIYSLLSTFLILTVFLASCGTTKVNTTNEQTPTETENYEEDTTENTKEQETVLQGTVTKSDAQNYSITVVDGFELTGEEPNKDLLFNTKNDAQSMRIETFNANEVDLNEVTSNLVETLKASNENGTLVEITNNSQLPIREFIQNPKGYQIDTPDGKVSGYTFEREGLIVKLTIFDTETDPSLETFVDMAETIMSK